MAKNNLGEKTLGEYSEAQKALARKNGEKILRALWDCMDQLGAVPLCLVVANFKDEITAITPAGLAQIMPIEKWIEVWPGGQPDNMMVGKIDTQ
jgi:hypothetical protein